MRYFISISYRGAHYCGWQIQKNGPSIQEEMERALSILLGCATSVTGAGRTDAGVNAVNFIAHFDSCVECLLTSDPMEFIYKMNAILPPDITVNNVYRVADDAHARFDATSRTYQYFVHTVKDPFAAEFSYPFYREVNLELMNAAAGHLLIRGDFSSFEKLHGGNTSSVCTVTRARWERSLNGTMTTAGGDNRLVFTISANRFLRNMVRAIVGTLLEVGCGKRNPDSIPDLLEKKDRCSAGQSVPGNALFLTGIEYPYKLMSIL
ncbi:MAG: tRNA pseudouridine(38-40) synthase TruA [Alistipes sp.]|nr:tRNA pseudouridine(38-40) synthase TruA [Candidatus Minthomonas equi]